MQKSGAVLRVRRGGFLRAVESFAISATLALAISSPMRSYAQSEAQDAAVRKFEFEVASVTPSNPDSPDGFMTIPGRGSLSDRYTAKNVTLMKFIRAAYGVPLGAEDSRISGGPDWLKSEKYDVSAKIDSSMLDQLKTLSPAQRTLAQQHMLQLLLADRCKLAVHRETKDLAIYTLVIAKKGSRLKEAQPGAITSSSSSGPARPQSISGEASPIASLVSMLSVSLGRPVLDNTGLTGRYDFKIEWTPDEVPLLTGTTPNDRPASQPDSSASSIFTAIQDQLGLKLVSGKGPVEVVVIDHVERPSAN